MLKLIKLQNSDKTSAAVYLKPIIIVLKVQKLCAEFVSKVITN